MKRNETSSQVFLILIVSLVGLISLTILIYEVLVEKERDEIIENRHNNLNFLIDNFEEKISKGVGIVEATSKLSVMKSAPLADSITLENKGVSKTLEIEKRDVAKNVLQAFPELHAMGMFLLNGDSYLVEPFSDQVNFKITNFSFRDWFIGAKSADSIYISELFKAQPGDYNAIAISIPVYSESGERISIWAATLDIEKLEKQLKEDFNELQFVIVDQNANVIVDSHEMFSSNDIIRSMSHLESTNNALAGQEGKKTELINGVEMFVDYRTLQIGPHNWAVLTVEPYEEVFGELTQIRNQSYIIVTIFGLLLGIPIYFRYKVVKTAVSENHTKDQRHLEEFLQTDHQQKHPEKYPSSQFTEIEKRLSKQRILYFVTLFFVVGVLIIIIVNNSSYVFFPIQGDEELKPITSSYLIQNLRGDAVETWLAWRIPEERQFHIHIQNSPQVTDERAKIIFDVIMSTESLEIDDSFLHKGPKGTTSTYYLGWYGALNSLDDKTKFGIPKNLHFHITDQGEGDVIIELKSYQNGDGYSGVTRNIADQNNNQILKAIITIYDVGSLSENGLETIVRHELGHAFGLAHSTAPEDLMYPEIRTAYPYISPCILDAIVFLYDGGESSQVVCEK